MDTQGDKKDMEDDFNRGIILPPLLIQLKKILDQYPDDSQILKELLQNAEDAGAKEVKFLYDKHSYGKDGRCLHHPDMAKYQGPALYAYNDGMFDEEDWKGIRMLSQSVKQSDPLKVGYFGLGFKSVFHLTDLPFVVSGERVGVIDPHQNFFEKSSYAWNINKRQDLLETIPHQFQPFMGLFDCTEETFNGGFYNGTMFRFPLRKQPSKLSDTIYTNERMQVLLQTFKQQGHLMLTFLRHLENIEVYERDERSLTPKLVFRIHISDDCLYEVRQKRAEFLNQIRNNSRNDRPLCSTYPVEVECTDFEGNEETIKRYKWLVTSYVCGGHVSAIFRKLVKDAELSYSPWVGTAMPLDVDSIEAENNEETSNARNDDGNVFCFLPLPEEGNTSTGLPVHVNGFFALEQNRKYIKWPSSGYQTREELMDKRLLWNQCMLREALPKAYTQMILDAIQRHVSGQDNSITVQTIYRAFPDFQKVDRKWDAILPSMFVELFRHSVVFTSANGGQWIEPRHAVFNTLDDNDEAREVITELLSASDVKLANVPAHVLQSVRNCCTMSIGRVTPYIVGSAYKDVQRSLSLPWESKIKLLRYFLKERKLDLLEGLELLPLANGGFHVFFYLARRADRPIYIASGDIQIDLMPGAEDHFLDPELDSDSKQMLVQAASRGYTQLRLLGTDMLASLLIKCLPASWQNGERVTWDPQEFGHPPQTWLQSLWNYLVRQCPRDLKPFEHIPLVPVSSTENGEPVMLYPLCNARVLLVQQLDNMTLPHGIEDILEKIGVSIIEELPDYISVHPLVNRKYIFSPSYIGVLRAVHRLIEVHGAEELSQQVQELTSKKKKVPTATLR